MNQPTPELARPDVSLRDRLFGLLLLVLPHHLLSRVVYWVTRVEWPPFKDWLIKLMTRLYRIDLSLAASPHARDYPHFNAFFTRALRPEMRPVAQAADAVVSPVDGTVSQVGAIAGGRVFQAKGRDYSLFELLGGEERWCEAFEDGEFATLYLSPRDYHRIHMPLAGRLLEMHHVPGRLFSVSPSTTRAIPRLFARNERIVNLFETEAGPMALIMVGAIFVASMDTAWAGTVAPAERRVSRWRYGDAPPPAVALQKGDETGRFNMGSTVILLFPRDGVAWDPSLRAGSEVRMGEQIGRL